MREDFTFKHKGVIHSRGEDGLAMHLGSPVAGRTLNVVASWGMDWEHVSVSVHGRPNFTPTWKEMEFVREVFWNDDETVMQLSPPRSERVNDHNGCLHLWRPKYAEIPMPPQIMV